MDISIRPATPMEAAALRALARASKAYWGYSEEFMQRWDYDEEITAQFVADRCAFCAAADGALAGFYALSNERPDPRLEHFWVEPWLIGHGIGRALLEHAVAQAASRDASSLVIHADPNAAPFYERFGARRVGEIDDTRVQQVFPVLELTLGRG